MARTQTNRSSTLIDPATLHARPTSQHLNSFGTPGSQQALTRQGSAKVKPLLTFDGDEQLPKVAPEVRIANSRSVFGVDTIWESEMAKLREIEAAEKLEAEAQEARIREEELRAERKKRKNKGKGKSRVKSQEVTQGEFNAEPAVQSRVSEEPPVLPSIPKATGRRQPAAVDDEESDESDESFVEIPSQSLAGSKDTGAGWHAGSSDEDKPVPLRTTGVGPRYKNAVQFRPADEDSEEDLPLAVAVERAVQRATGRSNEDSDEEKPLSVLLQKTKLNLPSSSNNPPSSKPDDADDDDDVPLGLRASKFIAPSQASKSTAPEGLDDDDRPLAFHPEQQRRTQYQMMAQQQHQLLMQAQLQSSMFFGAAPGMMGSGYFGQPIPAPMMVPLAPVPMPSPPPLHDAAKFGLVDRWRRDVVVEREP